MKQLGKTSEGKDRTRKSKTITVNEAGVPRLYTLGSHGLWKGGLVWGHRTGWELPPPGFDLHYWTCSAYNDRSPDSAPGPGQYSLTQWEHRL